MCVYLFAPSRGQPLCFSLSLISLHESKTLQLSAKLNFPKFRFRLENELITNNIQKPWNLPHLLSDEREDIY